MNIGIDIDNTIINYQGSFIKCAKKFELIPLKWVGTKLDLKATIIRQVDGNKKWERLQGKVYGEWIENAEINSGVKRFLSRGKLHNFSCVAISHKTLYGHYDEKNINLQKAATNFLIKNNIIKVNAKLLTNIYFSETKEEKINLINNCNLDFFIDDLPEILLNKKIAKTTTKILFDPYNENQNFSGLRFLNFDSISNFIMGEWSKKDFLLLSNQNKKFYFSELNPVNGGGNSKILKGKDINSKDIIIKFYPSDNTHNRMLSEYKGLQKISLISDKVPKTFNFNKELNFGVYEWINGDPIKNPSKNDINQAIIFLKKLHENRNSNFFKNFQNASASCFSGKDIENQLYKRLKSFEKVNNNNLQHFLKNDFSKNLEIMLAKAKKNKNYFNSKIINDYKTLSPSDFGFHNALKKKDGNIYFIDFEFFGIDDPSKLISDFYFHPGMDLDLNLKKYWLKNVIKIYDKAILDRLKYFMPLYGMCWILIILNDFKHDVWLKRVSANQSKIKWNNKTQNDKLLKVSENLEYLIHFNLELEL